MDLILTIKAVQSVQSFSEDITDECLIVAELLGVQVVLSAENMELLRRLDEVVSREAVRATQAEEGEPAIDYSLGNIDYSGVHADE